MESFAELAVHMEHIAGTHDIAFADSNRGRMAHRPGRLAVRLCTPLRPGRAILLNAMAACSCWGMGSSERWMSEDLGFQTIL